MQYPNYHDCGFSFCKERHLVHCNVCNVPLDHRQMAQHAQQKKHKAKLPAYLKKGDKQAFIEATIEAHQATNQLRGRTLDPDVKMIRFKFVRACLESNTPLGSANPMAELVEECSKMSVGDVL